MMIEKGSKINSGSLIRWISIDYLDDNLTRLVILQFVYSADQNEVIETLNTIGVIVHSIGAGSATVQVTREQLKKMQGYKWIISISEPSVLQPSKII